MSSSFRAVLDVDQIHPAIREKIANNHRDIVDEVKAAVEKHDLVMVGMKRNPFPRRARETLDEAGIAYHYMEYGTYFSQWRRRNALKMWTGWPTFPMIFVKGMLIGGAEDLERLIKSGELATLLAAPRA